MKDPLSGVNDSGDCEREPEKVQVLIEWDSNPVPFETSIPTPFLGNPPGI